MTDSGVSQIGKNIARYRKAASLSAEKLADLAGEGLSRSVIANLENGRKDDVTVRQLVALANALRVPPSVLVVDLFDPGAPSPFPMPQVPIEVFDRKEMRTVPGLTPTRNDDFRKWFSGDLVFVDNEKDGAAELVAGVLNALRGYHYAWGRFVRAIERCAAFGAESHNADEDERDYRSHLEEEAVACAVEAVRWVRELSSKGVTLSDLETEVQQVMDRAGIHFDFNVDSKEVANRGFSERRAW